MQISTNDLHCCKPARLLQLAPSGGRPHRRQPATAPPRITQVTTEPKTNAGSDLSLENPAALLLGHSGCPGIQERRYSIVQMTMD